jgi:hypothetical protein
MCVTPDINYLLQDAELHKDEESESPPTFKENNNMDHANGIFVLEDSPKEKDPVLTITLDSSTDSGESQLHHILI